MIRLWGLTLTLTYGEVSDSFAAFLAQDVLPAPTHHTPHFLDFGAGRGRLSLSLALQCPDWCLDGVEIVAPRTRHYPQLLTAYAYHRSRHLLSGGTLQLRCGDALAEDFSLYDVIFINNTVFDLNKVEGGLTSQILSKIATTMFVRPCLIISTKPLGLLNGARSRPIRVPLAAQHTSFCNNSVLQTIYLQTVQPL